MGVEPGKWPVAFFLSAILIFTTSLMAHPSHQIHRFSAKAAFRRRLIRCAVGFIAIAAMAVGSALILIVYEPDALTLHGSGLPSAEPEPVNTDHPGKTPGTPGVTKALH